MVYRPKIDPHVAFVLMPFKFPFDTYYDEIIKPAAKAVGLEVRKADEIYGTGPIIQDIWKQIWTSAVVIADVTGKNPNVNYELGISHALGVPTVIITQNLDDVPFDYKHRRCIPYKTDEVDWQRKLKRSITGTLRQVLTGEDVSPELGWPYDTSPFHREQRTGSLVPAENARDNIRRGVRMVCDALAYAYGPNGTHVSVTSGQGQRMYYRRGSAIAGSIHATDPLEKIGVNHSNELATQMRSSVGDGSKTAVLLFQKMVESGNATLKRNYPPADVLRGMERAIELIISGVRSQLKPLTGASGIQVARTAASGDDLLASLVVEAYKRAGPDGIVVIEQSTSEESALEVQEGMNFDRGYVDAAFVGPTELQECVLEDAYILIYDSKISSMKDLLPLLEQVAKTRKPLLIIADVEGEALATLVVNRERGTLNCLAVKAPGFGDRRRAILDDIAVLTGGLTISVSLGRRLDSLTLQDLGRARKVIVTRESTTILEGAGGASIEEHVRKIRLDLARSVDPFSTEKLRERLARLSGAIASIRVGGISHQERIDHAYAAESAMHSVQRAIEEGVVLGGGASLLRAKEALSTLTFKKPGEIAGVAIIEDAMEVPLRQLILNNRSDPETVLKSLKRTKRTGVGFNSETGKLQDLELVGVLDPVSTVTRAVQLAFSHARTLLETGAWDSNATEQPKKQDEALVELASPEEEDQGNGEGL